MLSKIERRFSMLLTNVSVRDKTIIHLDVGTVACAC